MTFPVVFHWWISGLCMATVLPVCNGGRVWVCLLYLSKVSVTEYSCQWLMIGYNYHLWAAHDEYSALLKCPGDCSCLAFNWCIPALCVSAESATCKYNAPSIGTTHWGFFIGAHAIIGSPCLPCSNLGLGRLPCWCLRW